MPLSVELFPMLTCLIGKCQPVMYLRNLVVRQDDKEKIVGMRGIVVVEEPYLYFNSKPTFEYYHYISPYLMENYHRERVYMVYVLPIITTYVRVALCEDPVRLYRPVTRKVYRINGSPENPQNFFVFFGLKNCMEKSWLAYCLNQYNTTSATNLVLSGMEQDYQKIRAT